MAAKIEVEFELSDFKIGSVKMRLKGDREDLPRINEMGRQFMGAMQLPASVLGEPVRKQIPSTPVPAASNTNGNSRSKARRAKGTASASDAADVPNFDWQHDAAKWGTPKQAWKAGQKVLWLLYVIKNEGGPTELSAASICEIFATKFKHFGALKKTSMPSILKALTTNDPALVMCDGNKTPMTCYLSEEGAKAAERLVIEARTPADSQELN